MSGLVEPPPPDEQAASATSTAAPRAATRENRIWVVPPSWNHGARVRTLRQGTPALLSVGDMYVATPFRFAHAGSTRITRDACSGHPARDRHVGELPEPRRPGQLRVRPPR